MKKQIISALVLFYFLVSHTSKAQTTTNIDSLSKIKISKLFQSERIVPVKMSYSSKEIKKETNDSTYITTNLEYQTSKGNWKTLELHLRGRGNFRLKNCTFPPLKLKIKKEAAKGTIFKGNKRLKMVMPCFDQPNKNDKVVLEYMAYKFYEILSPHHFKTRLLEVDFTDLKSKKPKMYAFKGFLIEDDKLVAKRHDGRVMDRKVHPLAQEAKSSVRNAFFQYMIGNTDFSVTFGHNEKLFLIDKSAIPVPYDFDMSGLVSASYAVVSQINGQTMPIESVRERLYRGFERPIAVFQEIRQEYLGKKEAIFKVIEDCKPMFESEKEFNAASAYIKSFYDILINDKDFTNKIIKNARKK